MTDGDVRWRLADVARLRYTGTTRPAALEAVMYLGMADSGSKPVHLVVDTGLSYWSKWPGNDHSDQSLVHEWVVARLGERLGAPVCKPSLIQVERDVVRGVSANGTSLPAATYFGSRHQIGTESTVLEWVKRDGNARRFAAQMALWELCLGEDPQFLYDPGADLQVWSIDHGLWFQYCAGPWKASELASWSKLAWEWPEGEMFGVSEDALLAAADSVGDLNEAYLAGMLAEVPLDWNVTAETLVAIGEFLLDRAPSVEASLRRRAGSAGMGR